MRVYPGVQPVSRQSLDRFFGTLPGMVKQRKFRLSNDKLLKGVCGGIAEGYKLDPAFVRLFYLLTATSSAIIPGVVIYLILWWVMPAAEAVTEAEAET